MNKNYFDYAEAIENSLDSACNNLSPNEFKHLIAIIKDLANSYED